MAESKTGKQVLSTMDPDIELKAVGEVEISSETVQLSWLHQLKLLWTSRRAALGAISCSSLAVLIGYDLMMIGSIIGNSEFVKSFGVYDESLKTWSLPADQQFVWTIVQYVFAIVGAFTVGQLSDICGRRIMFFITVCLTFSGTLVELFSPNWKVWVLGKFFFGTAMGFMQGNTPVYVSELAPVHIRGFMLSLFQLWIAVGVFISACVLEGTSTMSGPWSWKAAVSPYYLVNKGRMEQAKSSLSKLRGNEPGYDVEEDIRLIEATIAHEKESHDGSVSFLECFRGTDLRRTLLACLPMAMQQFLGFTLLPFVINDQAYFLGLAGMTNSFVITVISNLLGIFAILIAFTLIERIGRRPQLLIGSLIMVGCLAGMGILGFVNPGTQATNNGLAAVSTLWSLFYYISVGSIGWTIVGEISSTRLRAKTASIATMTNAILNMAWGIAIPYLINADEANLGPKAGFVFLVPGVILVQLDLLFELRTPARKF
ncbi:general substrate transporter [Hypoxylon sp. FL1150]|nr:general substrate transporter [Hypoxylon sp. FL1150]